MIIDFELEKFAREKMQGCIPVSKLTKDEIDFSIHLCSSSKTEHSKTLVRLLNYELKKREA